MRRSIAHPGFTLIELIAVIAITGILAAVAIPASLTLTSGRSAAASAQVQADLRFARSRAMTTGTPSWVTFSNGSHTYTVLAESTSTPGFASATTIVDPATGSAMVVRLNRNEFAGVTIVSANFGGLATVGFDRLGRPLKTDGTVLAADGTVTLSGSKTITVTRPTGRISGN